jgi:hypothetical protein
MTNRVAGFARELGQSRDFVEVGIVVCDQARTVFGTHQNVVALMSASGRPLISVDDVVTLTDEHRLAYFDDLWIMDPFTRAMGDRRVPTGDAEVPPGSWVELAREWLHR